MATLEYMPVDSITPALRNPKLHEIDDIRASIRRFGFVAPAIWDERTGRIAAGHGRRLAVIAMRDAREPAPSGIIVDDKGTWCIPVRRGWASTSDAEADAYLVADNQLTISGGWDEKELAVLLSSVAEADETLLETLGFPDDDLSELLASVGDGGGEQDAAPDEDWAPPQPEPAAVVTQPGDIWHLGAHRVLCGDCRNPSDVTRLLDGVPVNVAFTSPPYASQRKYDESSGFRPIAPTEYVNWFEAVQANVGAVLAEDGSWFVNIKEHCDGGQRDLYVKDLTIAHVRRWGWRFVDELCWVHSGLPGTWDNRHKNQFEPIFHFSRGRHIKFSPLANGIESSAAFAYSGELKQARTGNPISWNGGSTGAGEGIALPGNVLTIAKSREAIQHEAMFPVALPAWFLRAYSDPGDIVLDPFMGAGTTLIAAQQQDRIAYGTEISPAYCDVIARRYQAHTGEIPLLQRGNAPAKPMNLLEQP